MDKPDITVELIRNPEDGAWTMRASAHDVGYNHVLSGDENMNELDDAIKWLGSTVAFLMGCVMADQGKATKEASSDQ